MFCKAFQTELIAMPSAGDMINPFNGVYLEVKTVTISADRVIVDTFDNVYDSEYLNKTINENISGNS